MFKSFDVIELGSFKPVSDLLYVVVVTLRGSQDIKGIIELHIEGKIGVVREGYFFGKFFESVPIEDMRKDVYEVDG